VATHVAAHHEAEERHAISYTRTMKGRAARERMRPANDGTRPWQPRGDEGERSFGGPAASEVQASYIALDMAQCSLV
jgi:hypothetical protein